jgi:CRISPR-associated endonuclease/helicase Cas3
MTLTVDEFAVFFEEAHGYPPFPWQQRLLRHLVDNDGNWPEFLDLPTGSGKTSTMDVALFHLAMEADKKIERKAPVRIAFVVDRRLIVDDAHRRAQHLAEQLSTSEKPVTQKVAARLRALSGDGEPLIARQLRGGIPREDDWARTPCQPTILCSTVDQVGSRLLFRGYGVSDSMKPVHAGLLGTDCLILLDEAHLAEPFRQTLKAVEIYTSEAWRDKEIWLPPFRTALLTATPGMKDAVSFALNDEDYGNEILARRLSATKPARLIQAGKARTDTNEGDAADAEAEDLKSRLNALSDLVDQALKSMEAPAVAVVVNRVKRARALFSQLRKQYANSDVVLELIIGPARPIDRQAQAEQALAPIRTGHDERPKTPLIVIATQTIEAGVDIDFDALITEAAPIDALRQRFGRLNRAGRDVRPYAAIVAVKSDVSSRADDPVYGRATAEAWKWLTEIATPGDKKDETIVDFGINALKSHGDAPENATSQKLNAPILMPAHLDLFSQTSPVPACDPDVALYLHGPQRQPASVSVLWRADIARNDQDTHRLMNLMPPRPGEVIELPIGTVKGWLATTPSAYSQLADVPIRDEGDTPLREVKGEVYRFHRESERSGWIWPSSILPGDTIIIPCNYGGVDGYGFDPDSEIATDVADRAATDYAGKRFAIRVTPDLANLENPSELSNALAGAVSERWEDLRNAVLGLPLPQDVRMALNALDERRGKVQPDIIVYGQDEGKPRGVVFLVPRGLKDGAGRDEAAAVTEDDTSGTLMGFAQSLEAHSGDVERQARKYAEIFGMPGTADVALTSWLHDTGKADPRFQAWLHYGDPLGLSDDGEVLAKSGRSLPKTARSKTLPDHWRHEAQSVRIAREHPRFSEADDPELVLWLIGTHHGRGRPFFPHADDQNPTLPDIMSIPSQLSDRSGPQSLAFDYEGYDWSSLFVRLKAKYGVWGLAWLETLVRLADHRASETAQQGASA